MAEYNFYDIDTQTYQGTQSFNTDNEALDYARLNDLLMERINYDKS